jgi:hypothetical protein
MCGLDSAEKTYLLSLSDLPRIWISASGNRLVKWRLNLPLTCLLNSY